MHICFLTSEYPKKGFPHGGIGSFVKTIARNLVESGHQVSVVGINYLPYSQTEIEDEIAIYRLKKSNIKGLTWYFNSKKINKKIRTIHNQQPIHIVESAELGLAFINKIARIKYIIRLHGGHHFFAEAEKRAVNFWKGFQEKKSFKKADAFIAVSNYVKTHTEKYLSYHNKPISIIFNAIDTVLFNPITGHEIKDCIVFAGTVCEKKGVRQLIQAFPIVKKQFSNATLEVYGRDWYFPNGKSYTEMLKEEELNQLGIIANDIHFRGVVDYCEIPLKYSEASVCVFPSHMETLGLVAPEAMAMAKLVIFTNKGPGAEVIEHKKTGLLCNPHDPKDIAENIIWVLNNKQEAVKIAKDARISVLKRFEQNGLTLKNIAFYSKIDCGS